MFPQAPGHLTLGLGAFYAKTLGGVAVELPLQHGSNGSESVQTNRWPGGLEQLWYWPIVPGRFASCYTQVKRRKRP
jgi:hypothetical protein